MIASTSVEEDNAGYVAVIDGGKYLFHACLFFMLIYNYIANVLLTPFCYQNVPPPMCALKLTLDDNVQQVVSGPESSGTQLAVATNDSIQFFEVPANARGEAKTLGKVAVE